LSKAVVAVAFDKLRQRFLVYLFLEIALMFDIVRQAHQPLTNKLPKFECPNLPGFKNLAGLISGFIESLFLNISLAYV
jgi:hypothetical protein